VGIDGFALDFGGWSQYPYYQTRMAGMYQAANALGTGFKLFQVPDLGNPATLSAADILDAATSYCDNPAQLTYNGKCVLSAWAADWLGDRTPSYWQNNVLTPLANAGHPTVFVPHLFLGGNGTEMPTASGAAASESTWNSVVDGYYFFGLVGVPTYTDSPSLLHASEAVASVTHANNKIYMAPASLQYWGSRQSNAGRRYFEYYGGQGTENQWNSIINVQRPQWVTLTTWDDFGESYMTPSTSFTQNPWSTLPHGASLALASYFIQWFKTGVPPAITKDQLYYFYRQSPKSSGSACTDGFGNVSTFYGNITDSIYVTTLLTAPATLTVNTGGNVTTYNLNAGITHTTIPFSVSATQAFALSRGTTTLTSLAGPPIVQSPGACNFFYTTGYGYSDGTHYP
jgi:glucan endo-1,3-alpha-glucosidase